MNRLLAHQPVTGYIVPVHLVTGENIAFDEIYGCMARQLGLEYIYGTDAFPEPAAPAELAPGMLAALPAVLRSELKDALESLDGERIASAIRRAGEIDPELGAALSRLAEKFDYPAIVASSPCVRPSSSRRS